MILEKLSLLNFKNYQDLSLSLAPKINCFTGDNGSGKTNILDAIHYLSLCKSHINSQDRECIRSGQDSFVIQGEFSKNGSSDKILCSVGNGKKKVFKKNQKDYRKFSEHIGQFPSVMVSPSDNDLIGEGSEERRRFLDSSISQVDPDYLQHLLAYQKALKQRNFLLKQFNHSRVVDRSMIEIWDEQLCQHGEPIFKRRAEFVEELSPIFRKFYSLISGNDEAVDLVYSSQLFDTDCRNLMKDSFQRDLLLSYTTVGVHKDDLHWLLNSRPIRRFASQGQQKTYLTALKFANSQLIASRSRIVPLLLLDDLFDKFDNNRVENIIRIVSGDNFGQIFITDTNTERMRELLNACEGENCHFLVRDNSTTLI